MRLGSIALSASLAVLVAATAAAQQPSGNVFEVIRTKAQPGMAEKYEAGRKKHMDWHRKMADPWGWTVGQITTGPDSGTYLVVTGGHEWQDFDTWVAKMGDGDSADAAVNLAPYQGESETQYWVRMPEYGLAAAPGSEYPMATITYFHLKPGATDAFFAAVKQIDEAGTKAGWTRPANWYRLANGGQGGTFCVVGSRKNMAEMAAPSPGMSEAVEKHLGKAAADAMWKSFSDSIRYTETEMIQWRSDLSYQPAAR
jgi:hypothetical protein